MYYAEEIAQRDIKVPNAVAYDPPARRAGPFFRWWNRDQCRGPMAWRPGPGGGFTTGSPWLPLPPDADARNVAVQSADPDSVMSLYRRLLALRRATPALHAGGQELIDAGDVDVLAYVRRAEGSGAFVALNFASRSATTRVPPTAAGRSWRVALSTPPRPAEGGVDGGATLAPLEALIAVEA
jgi:alpha-glucosidase